MKNRRFESPFLNAISSLKLAGVLLLTLAFFIILATCSQSFNKASQAWVNQTYYYTWWFMGLQALILTNMWIATVRIFQGTWRQLGVIVIHIGVTALMVGSFITHRWGIVGARLDLWEGESSDTAFETENFVADVFWKNHESTKNLIFNSPYYSRQSDTPWDIPTDLGQLTAVTYFPDGHIDREVIPSEETTDPPGIELKLHLPGMPLTPQKVLSSQPPANSWHKGNFSVAYLDLPPSDSIHEEKGLILPALKIQLSHQHSHSHSHEEKTEFALLDPRHKEKIVPLGPWELQWDQFITSAIFNKEGKLNPDDDQWRNPAFSWHYWPKGKPEEKKRDWFFVLHPDFHGSQHLFEVFFEDISPLAPYKLHENLAVTTWEGKNPDIWQQLIAGCWVRTPFQLNPEKQLRAPFQVGQSQAEFELVTQHEHVRAQTSAHLVKDDLGQPTIAWTFQETNGTQHPTQWVPMGEKAIFDLSDQQQVTVSFQPKAVPLGFKVKLKDVNELKDPGTTAAATWFSDIEISDPQQNFQGTFRINMNDPIDYGGYRFFQSNYLNDQGREQSGIQIAKDPGFMIYYVGIVVIVVGMILNFYLQDFLSRLDKKG